MILLNALGKADVLFFIILFVIIAIAAGLYFLIPVLKKKQFAEMRENLRKREIAYNENLQRLKEEQEKKNKN